MLPSPARNRWLSSSGFTCDFRARRRAQKSSSAISSGSGPSLVDARRVPFDPAELPWIVVQQHAVVERKDAVRVLPSAPSISSFPVIPRCTASVPCVQRDDDKLAAPFDFSMERPSSLAASFRRFPA